MTTLGSTVLPGAASERRSWLANHPLLAYFIIAFAGTWLLVWPMALIPNLPDPAFILLFILSSFIGPTVGALVVTAATEGRTGVKAFLRRFVLWRVGPQWYLAALGANLAIWVLGYAAIVGPGLLGEVAANWPLLLSVFLPQVVFGILIPSLGEEPGWRGFALPRLQERHGPVYGSLILGTLHGIWHLPAFFTPLLGPFSIASFVPFVITAALATFIYTYIFNHTRGSILIAMLIHASGNAASQYLTALFEQGGIALPEAGLLGAFVTNGWLNVAAYGVAALLLIVLTRGRLGYRAAD
jgi:membrane protease YdiL (CAAX protease family)